MDDDTASAAAVATLAMAVVLLAVSVQQRVLRFSHNFLQLAVLLLFPGWYSEAHTRFINKRDETLS